jgi:hypothetical protein
LLQLQQLVGSSFAAPYVSWAVLGFAYQTMNAKAAANPLAVTAIGADSRERPFLERHGLEEAAEMLKG